MTDFVGFSKIPRLFREIVVTEKIDGTNAQIVVPENPNEPLVAGSRKQLLTVENDNFGFAAWVAEHEDELRKLGPGRHFGEWWGRKIQRTYGLAERRFSLFNVSRWRRSIGPYSRANEIGTELCPLCCDVVPILYGGPFAEDMVRFCLDDLVQNGSRAALGFMNPEGIVVYHTAANQCFKVTIEKDERPKGKTR